MTKNAHFILLLIFAVSRLAFSQDPINIDEYKVIDQSRFVVTYEAMMTKDSVKPTEHKFDRLVLMVGDSISTCYSNTMHRFDSAFTVTVRKGGETYRSVNHFIDENGDVWVPDVYKYYAKKRMTVVHRMEVPGNFVPIFLYDEPLSLMDWKMSFETKEILGYQCFKAECDFRGRHWTAWFTMQIPVQDGPWKFSGLPGLILQMEESRGHYAFRCIGIETRKKPIVWYNNVDYQSCKRSDVVKQMEDYHTDWNAYVRRVFPGKIVRAKNNGSFEKVPVGEKRVLPYNPVELK
jgi:GLPGLI family protein